MLSEHSFNLHDVDPSQVKVGRRYFFRGLEDSLHRFPRAAHYDCILEAGGPDVAHATDSRVVSPRSKRRVKVRCEYVDTLVSALRPSPDTGSVRMSAEDLADFVALARPFSAMDAPPMLTIARDLVRHLAAGTLELYSNAQLQAEEALAGERARSR
jgi:hypothetical protein